MFENQFNGVHPKWLNTATTKNDAKTNGFSIVVFSTWQTNYLKLPSSCDVWNKKSHNNNTKNTSQSQ